MGNVKKNSSMQEDAPCKQPKYNQKKNQAQSFEQSRNRGVNKFCLFTLESIKLEFAIGKGLPCLGCTWTIISFLSLELMYQK